MVIHETINVRLLCTGCLGLSAGFAVFTVVPVCGVSFIADLLAFTSSSTSAASVNCFIFAMKDGSSAFGETLGYSNYSKINNAIRYVYLQSCLLQVFGLDPLKSC